MTGKSTCLTAAGVAILLLAGLLAFRSVDQGAPGGAPSDPSGSTGAATARRQLVSGRDQPHGRKSGVRVPHSRRDGIDPRIGVNPNDLRLRVNFRQLDWSVDDLDEFLKTQKTQLSDHEIYKLMICILPAKEGARHSGNSLKPGSIPLKDQVVLIKKYVDPTDHQALYSNLWYKCRESNSVEEYRRDVVEQMPPGHVRTSAVANYYHHVYKDYPAIQELLVSDEFPTLKAQEGASRSGGYSDHAGAVRAVQGSLRDFLDQGDATVEDIVATVRASKLDEGTQAKIIRSIEKRAAELVILRSQVKPNSGE